MVVCSCSEHLYERLKQSDPERATGRETIPLTNDELFTFHSVRAMLNEMVKSVEECDVLVWCGNHQGPFRPCAGGALAEVCAWWVLQGWGHPLADRAADRRSEPDP